MANGHIVYSIVGVGVCCNYSLIGSSFSHSEFALNAISTHNVRTVVICNFPITRLNINLFEIIIIVIISRRRRRRTIKVELVQKVALLGTA